MRLFKLSWDSAGVPDRKLSEVKWDTSHLPGLTESRRLSQAPHPSLQKDAQTPGTRCWSAGGKEKGMRVWEETWKPNGRFVRH